MLSIIIPTLNEEGHLQILLNSIKEQGFKDYEIIISDAGSDDSTKEVAQKYGCKIVAGGFPASGKNRGAEAVSGEVILFIDADTCLDGDSLGSFLKEFKERNLDIATFLLKSREKFHNLSYAILFNFTSTITEKFLPQAMNVILIKRSLHQKIGGFNEMVKIGEELDYIRRAAKLGKFGVLKSAKIFASSRRFKQDGWLRTWMKYFLCQIYMFFFGPVKSDILKYKFNHYSKNIKNQLK